MPNNTEKDELRKRIWESMYQPKLESLVNELEFLLKGKKYEMSQKFKSIHALEFEFDSPLDFMYAGYPSYEYRDDWFNTVVINITDKNDNEKYQKVLNQFFVDFDTTIEKIDNYFWGMLVDIEYDFFSSCWIEAKRKSKSRKISFVYRHENSSGMSCDTKRVMNQKEIEEYIKKMKTG